jgi:hypothetical protein
MKNRSAPGGEKLVELLGDVVHLHDVLQAQHKLVVLQQLHLAPLCLEAVVVRSLLVRRRQVRGVALRPVLAPAVVVECDPQNHQLPHKAVARTVLLSRLAVRVLRKPKLLKFLFAHDFETACIATAASCRGSILFELKLSDHKSHIAEKQLGMLGMHIHSLNNPCQPPP